MASFAFIGFGALASELARGLRAAGVRDLRASTRSPANLGATRLLAERLQSVALRNSSLAEAVRGADIVMATVPAGAAAAVARASAPLVRWGAFYVDAAPRPPAEKAISADLLDRHGAAYVDAAMLGTVVTQGFRVHTLASGPGAVGWRDAVVPLGMKVSVVEGPAGRATLIKLLRSIYTKGRDALILEMVLAAHSHGLENTVIDSLEEAGARSFRDLADRVVRSVAVYADRRADELNAVGAVVRETGVTPLLTDASQERLRSFAELGLRERFHGERPPDVREVMSAIDVLSSPL